MDAAIALSAERRRQHVTIPKPRLVSHEVVSEYSVGPLKNSDSHNLFEFRQVVSVDGKAVRTARKRPA